MQKKKPDQVGRSNRNGAGHFSIARDAMRFDEAETR